MNKILSYSLGVLALLHSSIVDAIEKFEVLPDLPDRLPEAARKTAETDRRWRRFYLCWPCDVPYRCQCGLYAHRLQAGCGPGAAA